jgi:hypothetical protein
MLSRLNRLCLVAGLVIAVTPAAIAQRPAKGAPPAKTPAKTAPKAPAERRVPYAVGELLSYDVSWSSYVTAGTLTLKVESKKPSYSSTAYYVTAEAQSTGMLAKLYPLYYKADTLIDSFTLLPQRGSLYSRENRRERLKITTFDHAKKTGLFEMKTASHMRKDLKLPALTQDLLSAIYVLRAIQPRTGDRLEVPVSDSGWLYKVTFVIGAVESVKKADGTAVPALKVTPEVVDEGGKRAASGTVFWLSNDAALKPVRIEGALAAGRIVIALK